MKFHSLDDGPEFLGVLITSTQRPHIEHGPTETRHQGDPEGYQMVFQRSRGHLGVWRFGELVSGPWAIEILGDSVPARPRWLI